MPRIITTAIVSLAALAPAAIPALAAERKFRGWRARRVWAKGGSPQNVGTDLLLDFARCYRSGDAPR